METPNHEEGPLVPESPQAHGSQPPPRESIRFLPKPPRDPRPQSLQIDGGKQEYKEKEKRWSRTSILSDLGSAAARRRSYNGPAYTHPPTAEVTAQSRFSIGSISSLRTFDTYVTATSYVASYHTAPSIAGDNPSEGSVIRRTFRRLLNLNGVESLVEEDEPTYDEYDWCGRGMHVDFAPGEKIPLEVRDSAGHGSTASIDIVKCRRIQLARKLTYLTHRTNQKLLLKEVQALQKLRHAHVIQLVGTYRQGRKFAALLYPVADMDLAHYLEEARYMEDASEDFVGPLEHTRAHQDVLSKGSLCLISALRYIHESGVKHMDIKPANILLKRYNPAEAYSQNIAYKLYLCDFGISQAHNPDEQSQTETYPGKTPMYASPEVAALEEHGRASDVFSLGCVLLEMTTVYSGLTVESLKKQVQMVSGHYYHNNLECVRSWLRTLEDMRVNREVIEQMLQYRPEERPSLVKQREKTNIIDLECLHHDPPDLFEVDETTSPTEVGFASTFR